MIPLAGAILLVQGIVEIIRCVICIKRGRLAVARGRTSQEVDVDKLKEMVHVKDEDIAEARRVRGQAGAGRVKMRKELWFGFALMAMIVIPVIAAHALWTHT